jgi:polyvinyl alcohol dehydrogenase (cytochrome)
VQALRRDSGCLQWSYQAVGPVRAAPVVTKQGKQHVVLFGDLTGWFYALDAATGKELWKKRPEEHESVRLSTPPAIYNGLALIPVASWEETRAINNDYPCCTFRGSITALRIADGSQAWKTFTIPNPPKVTGKTPVGTDTIGPSGVGVWSTPTLDLKRKRIYITTGNNYSLPNTIESDSLMALDLDTGRMLWSKQVMTGDVYNSACGLSTKGPSCPPEGSGPDYDLGTPAMLVKDSNGREILMAGQKSGMVYAFDPDKQGEILWQTRVGEGGVNGGVQWGMASDGDLVFATTSDAIIHRTALVRTLDAKHGGGLTALRITDGTKAWYAAPPPCGDIPSCSPAQPAAVTVIPGIVFAASLDGHLRAYSAKDGSILWDFNSVRDFETVNGVKAKGGGIDGPGATVVNGMVFVNSGYSRQGGIAGNVFLAFAPE